MKSKHLSGGPATVESPRIFLSYRSADWTDADARELLVDLTGRFRSDLGDEMVFRDKDDLIAGQPWQVGLDAAIDGSDTTIFLIGEQWTGPGDVGARRIDAENDPVRQEVRRALDPSTAATPLPVLIDRDAPPPGLPDDVKQLFARHAVITTMSGLANPESVDYQRLLVGAWWTKIEQVQNGILIIGDGVAEAEIHIFVRTLKAAKCVDARELSRLGSGAYVLPARKLKRKAKAWPDVIVLTNERDTSNRMASLQQALDEHPRIKAVAVVGVGAAFVGAAGGAVAVASSWSGASGTTTFAGHAGSTSLVSTTPSVAGISVGGTLVGAKVIAAGLAATAATAVGVGVAVTPDNGADLTVEYVAQTTLVVLEDDDPQLHPLGQPGDIQVLLGAPVASDAGGSLGTSAEAYVERGVTLVLPSGERVELGPVVLPTALSQGGIELNDDRRFRVASISDTRLLRIEGVGTSKYCFRTDDRSTTAAGYRFTGEPADLRVDFAVTTAEGKVVGEAIVVTVTAEAERELLIDPADADLSGCPATDRVAEQWATGG